ncbi:hypothetical protein PG996_014483 [Apiospora saccharicola]|uniref:Aminoglycoside phosphotransferase domain-containing protein n=1 Tax=Apiospora saccharicola TaxID=335842 RepID=A0ABR1TIG8_9PEZI
MAAAQPQAEIQSKVLRSLEGTPFAAKSLVPLSGGTANFIYLADLAQPHDGVAQVLVKHGEGFLASNPGFQLPTSRCVTHRRCLSSGSLFALGEFFHTPSNDGYNYVVRTPKHYPFPQDPNTQIQEYLPNGTNLKAYALEHWSASPAAELTDVRQQAQAKQLGLSLGQWLRAFHDYSSELHRRDEMRSAVAANGVMQGLKHTINFQWLLDRVAQFPDILTETVPVFEEVKEMAAAELRDENRLQVIHGDFWTGNILIPNAPIPPNADVPIFVVDWEMAQLGVPSLDLGQMLAEMYELWLYKRVRAGLWMMEGLIEGYGAVTETSALRAAVQLGAHLVCFGTSVPGWGTPEQVQEIARTGRDIICRAWRKDRAWFESGELACLFSIVKRD